MSPRGVSPSMYKLTGRMTTDLFAWPEVEGDANIHGPLSFAIPSALAGYDLMRLFTGSWGSLGLITELTLRTFPLPPRRGEPAVIQRRERQLQRDGEPAGDRQTATASDERGVEHEGLRAVECEGALTKGMTVVDVDNVGRRPPNADVALGVDRDRFTRLLVSRIAELDANPLLASSAGVVALDARVRLAVAR